MPAGDLCRFAGDVCGDEPRDRTERDKARDRSCLPLRRSACRLRIHAERFALRQDRDLPLEVAFTGGQVLTEPAPPAALSPHKGGGGKIDGSFIALSVFSPAVESAKVWSGFASVLV